MNQANTMRIKAQKLGSKLSAMILPNLGAFMGWGILTALGVFLQNDLLTSFISPMLTYLLPILIAVSGGKMIYGDKGSVIGAFATFGVIIGATIPMLLGAMIMAPLSAWLLKKIDGYIKPHIPTGFELLISNLTIAIIGVILALLGATVVAPGIESLSNVFSVGVAFLEERSLLPLTAIFIEPAKILFLNNAIGQGILTPLGTTQLESLGKSVLFLLESNPGPGLGILLAFMVYGRGSAKSNAYGASVIHFFGGIHEIYFPFILMKPILVVAAILGGITGTFLFGILKVGLVGVSSPGSIIAILLMSAPGDQLKIVIGILGATVVSFLVAAFILRRDKSTAGSSDEEIQKAAAQMEALKGKKSSISSVFNDSSKKLTDYAKVQTIMYVCDAGMGSSAMGASIIAKKLKKAGISDIEVPHVKINDLPREADVIVTHASLADIVKEKQGDVEVIVIDDYLNAPEYETLVENILEARNVN